MKIEEAKEQLKDLIKDRESFLDGQDDEIYRRDIEALEKAVEILEKQIPKKPKREPEPYPKHFLEGVDGFYCPICGRDLIDEDNDCFEYCPDCGQAIDWSEEE